MELDILMVGIAQFTRTGMRGNDNQRPELDWLQGGGFMEQHPTHILLLHTPPGVNDWCEVIVAKNRHTGRHSVVRLAIQPEFCRYSDYKQEEPRFYAAPPLADPDRD